MRAANKILAVFLSLAALQLALPTAAFASVSLTRGQGGSAISADQAATVGGAFTTLTNPSLLEAAPGDISTGSLILAAPAGFEFRRQRVTAFATPGGSNPTSLLLSAAADCTATARSVYLTAESDRISLHVCQTSEDSGKRTRLTLSGLSVRPLEGTPLASGGVHLDAASTAMIDGVTEGPAGTSFADLAVVPGDLAAIALDPASAVLSPEGTQAFTGEPRDQFGNARVDEVTWAADATVGTVTADGAFTAGTTVASATAGVTATAGDLSVAAPVEVQAGQLARLAITPADTETVAGQAVAYSVEAFDAHGNSRGPADEAVLTLKPIDGGATEGTSCADDGACVATRATGYTVVATFEDITETTSLGVVPAALHDVLVTPAAGSVKAGEQLQFDAEAVDVYGNTRDEVMAWTAEPAAGSIDEGGLLTAATTTVEIPAAVAAATGGIDGTADLEITAGPVETLTITPETSTAVAGQQVAFATEAFDAYGNAIGPVEATYDITTDGDGSAQGAACEAAACAATAAGSYLVSASYDGRKVTTTLTVVPDAATLITLAPGGGDLRVDEVISFTATVTDQYGNVRDDAVTFTANPEAGTIEESTGVFTAGQTAGTVSAGVIAALGDLRAIAPVTIRAGDLASLTVSPADATHIAGEAADFDVTGADAYGNPVSDIAPTFGITAVAGGASEGAVCDETGRCAATGVGTYRIDIAAREVATEATLHIDPAELAGISISPTTVEVVANEITSFEGTPVDAYGNVRDDVVSYAVADDAAGTVDGTGLFRAGTATGTFADAVMATTGGFSAAAEVIVVPADVHRLEISPLDTTAVAGESTMFTADAYDEFDNSVGEIDVSLLITPDQDGATEGASCAAGTCSAERVGRYLVTATYEDVEVSTSLTIIAAELAALDVAPDNADAVAGAVQVFAASGSDAFGNPVETTATAALLPDVDGSQAGATCDADGACGAEAAGSYIVRFSDGEVTGEATLDVVAAALEQVEIDPPSAEVPVTGQLQLTGTAIDRFGNPTGDAVTFEVTDDRVGEITADGLLSVSDIADFYPGSVHAAAADVEAYADVEILPGDVDHLVLIPEVSAVEAGDFEVFAVEGVDAYGNSLGAVDAAFSLIPVSDGSAEGAVCSDGGECTATIVGTYAVTASHESGASVAGELYIDPAAAAAVKIDPSEVTLSYGGSVQLAATVTDAYGNVRADEPVAWAVDEAVGTITEAGVLTAGTTPGTSPSGVTATADAAVGTAQVTVAAGDVAEIRLSPESASVVAGAPQAYSAQGYDQYGTQVGEVWVELSIAPADGSSTDAGASCVDGACTASLAGEYTITGSHNGVTDSVTLVVLAGEVAEIRLSPESVSVVAGEGQVFVAEGFDAHGNSVGVVAAELSIDPSGVCGDGSCSATAVGEYTVTGSFEGLTDAVVLSVVPAEAASVRVEPSSVSVVAGGSVPLGAVVADAFGNVREDVVVWAVDEAAGSVDADGLLVVGGTAGEFPGAVSASVDGLVGTADVVVLAGEVAEIRLSPESVSVVAGEGQVFVAEGFDAHGNSVGVVAAELLIDPSGVCGDGSCSATAVGEYTVTASFEGLTDAVVLSVVPAEAASVRVEPSSVSVVAGGSVPLGAVVADAFGNVREDVVVWAVDEAAGSVDADGLLVVGGTAGEFPGAVSASVDGLVGTADVVVLAGEVAEIRLSPESVSVVAGEGQVFVAEGFDAHGNSVGVVAAELLIDPSGVCGDGSCSATAVGEYTVTGSFEGLTDAVVLSVVPAEAASVRVEPSSVSVVAGGSVPLGAVVADAFGNVREDVVVWAVDEAAGSVDADGLLVVGGTAGEFPGAVSASVDGLVGTADVVVLAGEVAEIRLSPESVSVVAGEGQVFVAEGFDAHGNSVGVVAAELSIDPSGVCGDGSCSATAVGEYTVTGSFEGLTDAVVLSVVPAEAASVRVEPSSVSVVAGGSVPLGAVVADAFGNVREDVVVWAVDEAAGSVDADGLLVVGGTAGEFPGAVSASVDGLVGTADVVVLAGEVAEIRLSPESVSVVAGEGQVFVAEGFDAHGNSVGVVAAELSIDPSGVCGDGSCSATAVGEYTVTASFEGLTDAVVLSVVPAEAASVRVEPSSVSVVAGGSVPLGAVVADAFGNVREDVVVWAVDEAAGSVDADGLLVVGGTAGEFPGAVSASVDGLVGTADVVVLAGEVAEIRLSPESVSVVAGEGQVFVAEGFDAHGNSVGVVAAELSIDPSGVCGDGSCSATAVGEYTVTASYEGLTDTASVSVSAAEAETLVLDPAMSTVLAGDSQPYQAEAFDRYGNATPVPDLTITLNLEGGGQPIDCSESICSTTLAGTHTVTATSGTASGSATLTVLADEASAVMIEPSPIEVGAGQAVQLTATSTDQHGNPTPGDVAWTADPEMGVIDEDGLLTAGETVGDFLDAVTATVGDATGTADIRVVAGPVEQIVLDPAEATIAAGESQIYTANGLDAFGNSTGTVPVTLSLSASANGTCAGSTCSVTNTGVHTVTASAEDGLTDTGQLTVTGGPVVTLDFLATPNTVQATPLPGNTSTLTFTARDQYGNPVTGAEIGLRIEQANSGSGVNAPTLSSTTVTTNAAGYGQTTYSAGTRSGIDTVSAMAPNNHTEYQQITVQAPGVTVGNRPNVVGP